MEAVPPTPDNDLAAFARAHGFSHGLGISWSRAVGLIAALDVQRRVDMGDREGFWGIHPELGTLVVMLSTISQSYVLSHEDLTQEHPQPSGVA